MVASQQYKKDYYLKNKDKILETSKKRANEKKDEINRQRRLRTSINRQKILVHYSKEKIGCVCCGEEMKEFLVIDHINGGGTEHRKKLKKEGGDSFYAWLIRNKFPRGYQILCFNCNWAKTRYGGCPHNFV